MVIFPSYVSLPEGEEISPLLSASHHSLRPGESGDAVEPWKLQDAQHVNTFASELRSLGVA